MTIQTVTRRITPLMLRQRLQADGVLFRAYRCWTAAATWTGLPRRRDLAELENAHLQDWIGVAEAQAASGQFHYLALGRGLQRMGARDPVGGMVGGTTDPSPSGDLDRAAFLESAFQERIVFSRRHLAAPPGDPLRLDRLVLPLRGEPAGTALVLFAQDSSPRPNSPWPPSPWPTTRFPADAMPLPTGQVVETERLALSAMDPAHEHQSSS